MTRKIFKTIQYSAECPQCGYFYMRSTNLPIMRDTINTLDIGHISEKECNVCKELMDVVEVILLD